MKIRLTIAAILLFTMFSVSEAAPIVFDTRIGVLPDVGIFFRVSRIEYELTSDLSGRIVNSVIDGMGLTGNLNKGSISWSLSAVPRFNTPPRNHKQFHKQLPI